MEPYITLTPIGEHKQSVLEEFFSSIRNFDLPPEEIIVCVDLDSTLTKLKEREYLTVLLNPEIFCSVTLLKRICSAREILRNYFIKSKYNWALWLDSDIIGPPELPRTLLEVADKEKVILVSNLYQGRGKEKWSGSGIMLTHKLACTISHFFIGNIYNKHLSEDYMFLSGIQYSEPFLKRWSNFNKSRITGEFVKVKHLFKRG